MKKRRGKIHYARLKNSPRLQRLLRFLRKRGKRGATTLECVYGADVAAVNTAADELRENGIPVSCTQEGRRFRYRLGAL